MFIQKEEIPLKSSLRSRRGGPFCTHTGTGRRSLQISIFRHEGGRRVRLAALKVFRSCCMDSSEARAEWWRGTLAKLDEIYGPSLSRREHHDRAQLELKIRRLISLPKGLRPMQKDLKAALKTAKECAVSVEQAMAARCQSTSACWGTIGVFPGASYKQIKAGLQEKLNHLNMTEAPLGEFKIAHAAAAECLERLTSGVW